MGAEFLAGRALAVEAIEDRGQLVFRDAGPVILDGDQHGPPVMARGNRISPPGGLNEMALAMRLAEDLDSRVSMPGTQQSAGRAPADRD